MNTPGRQYTPRQQEFIAIIRAATAKYPKQEPIREWADYIRAELRKRSKS